MKTEEVRELFKKETGENVYIKMNDGVHNIPAMITTNPNYMNWCEIQLAGYLGKKTEKKK